MGSSVSNLIKTVTTFAKTNSPLLTTSVGASGVVLVAVLAARAGAKAEHDLIANYHLNVEPTAKEKVALTWRYYIPVVAVAGITVGAIVTGHKVNATRTAAAAAAFSLSERTFAEYRNRIVEKLGVEEERAVRTEVRKAEQHRDEHSPVIIMDGQNVTCLDMFSGRYFASNMQSIRAAVNSVNHIMWQQMYASLTEFYDHLGLPPTSQSDHVGWNNDRPLEVAFGTAMTPDDKPCLVINFVLEPRHDYATFG